MDTTSKLFIYMVVLALVIGAFVIKFKPQHNLATVYKSNARYYPHINDDTVLKKVQKPKPAVVDAPAGVSDISTGQAVLPTKESDKHTPVGKIKPAKKKTETGEFIPD